MFASSSTRARLLRVSATGRSSQQPAGGSQGKATELYIVSLAADWREVELPFQYSPSIPPLFAACGMVIERQRRSGMCGQRGCGGVNRCSNPNRAAAPLHFQLGLSTESAQRALGQLHYAVSRHDSACASTPPSG